MASAAHVPDMPSSVNGTPGTRNLTRADLDAVLDLHHAAFPSNVWTRFGGRLLTTYLRLFLESPHAVAIATESAALRAGADGVPAPAGHLVGILDTGLHRSWIWRHGSLRLMLALVPAAINHPRLLAGLLGRRLSGWRRRATGARQDHAAVPSAAPASRHAAGPVAVLSHVAVHPSARGNGLGAALVKEFVDQATRSGAGYACLATLEQDGVGDWYDARGWALDARRQTFDGRAIRIYRHTLDQDGTP